MSAADTIVTVQMSAADRIVLQGIVAVEIARFGGIGESPSDIDMALVRIYAALNP